MLTKKPKCYLDKAKRACLLIDRIEQELTTFKTITPQSSIFRSQMHLDERIELLVKHLNRAINVYNLYATEIYLNSIANTETKFAKF